MSKYIEKQNIMSQIVELERLIDLVNGHPLMIVGLEEKLIDLRKRLEAFDVNVLEPKIAMLFSGNAVLGSQGIKSLFVSNIIKPIQEMIKAQTAEIKFKKVGKRGKTKGSRESNMFLTALPVGSFGIELVQLDTPELFSELDVSSAIEQVSEIIKGATDSDESFANIVEQTPTRTLNNLKIFLREVANENSIIKIHINADEIYIDEDHVKLGYLRVKEADESEVLLTLNGILRGLLLEANKFEFLDVDGHKYSGKISEELDTDDLANFGKDYLNESCRVTISEITIKLKGSTAKHSYTLVGIDQVDQ
ncbi:hypothetical protein [Sphingobacterium anhuiense]|uniref:Uncharacterized protein n=1 Tax=Sphingobacterium anhuiense TaxID=493780 RepID=A0ABW5YTU4_9SPHI